MEPEELANALVRLTEWAEERAPEPEPPVRRRLREHFNRDPAELPIVARSLEPWDRPNFQVAVDEWTVGRDVEVVGLPVMQGYRALGWRSSCVERSGCPSSSSAPWPT